MLSTQNQAEHGVIQSSIVLLQERFKQLQRVKEMREKKELLTIFSDYKKTPTDSYNYEPATSHNTANNDDNYNDHSHDNDDDDELQIFLPPNYYHSNYNRIKPSCNSSSSSPSPSPSSSILSHHNNHNNYHNNLNDISLTLWPPTTSSSYKNATAVAATAAVAAAEHFRRASSTMSTRPSSCVSSAYKFEDSHVSDVDTTLHL